MKIFAILLILIISVTSVHAGVGPNAGQERAREQALEKEKSRGLEKTREKRKTEGKREGKRVETAVSRSLREAARKALSLRSVEDYMVDLDAADVLRMVVSRLELENVEPFGSCRLLTDPPDLKDFGVSFTPDASHVDLLEKALAESRARSWAMASPDAFRIRKLVSCSLAYAEILASAELHLKDWVKAIGEDWLGVQDLIELSHAAIATAAASPDPGITRMISRAKRAFAFPCRFRGEIETLRCGALDLSVRPTLTLHLKETEIYGKTFLGLRAHFRVSRAFSLDRAWEEIKSRSKSERSVRELVNYVEETEARGEIARASMLKKKLLRQMARGNISINISPLPF